MFFVEFESVVHETAVASQIFVITIQEVLLRQGHQLSGLDKLGTCHDASFAGEPSSQITTAHTHQLIRPLLHTFEGTRRGKGPARATRSLVLDIDDSAELDPVD